MKLTKRTVEAAAATDQRRIVWDDQVKGFGLVIQPTGVKSYIFRYRSPEGNRESRITLGHLETG